MIRIAATRDGVYTSETSADTEVNTTINTLKRYLKRTRRSAKIHTTQLFTYYCSSDGTYIYFVI